jgi:hypothetical protein
MHVFKIGKKNYKKNTKYVTLLQKVKSEFKGSDEKRVQVLNERDLELKSGCKRDVV